MDGVYIEDISKVSHLFWRIPPGINTVMEPPYELFIGNSLYFHQFKFNETMATHFYEGDNNQIPITKNVMTMGFG